MENRCVSCGLVIPEGSQVCPNCRVAYEYTQAVRRYREMYPNKEFDPNLCAFRPGYLNEELQRENDNRINYDEKRPLPKRTIKWWEIK